MRKPLMAVAIVVCVIMTVVGGLEPILQGWIFFVIALFCWRPSSSAAAAGSRPPVGGGHGLIAGSSGRATIAGRRPISRNSSTSRTRRGKCSDAESGQWLRPLERKADQVQCLSPAWRAVGARGGGRCHRCNTAVKYWAAGYELAQKAELNFLPESRAYPTHRRPSAYLAESVRLTDCWPVRAYLCRDVPVACSSVLHLSS